jgi:hypothetical protein
MKNVKVFFTALLLSLSFVLPGCTRDATLSTTEEILIRNSWGVDYFFQNQDITTEFGDASLLFSSTGAVGYKKNGVITAGTWSKTADASNNEFLIIIFNTSDTCISQLNETWKLTSRSANSLQFEENNGGNNTVFWMKSQ